MEPEKLKHNGAIRSLVFSPDGKILASGGADKTVRLWDMQTGSQIRKTDEEVGPFQVIKFTNDGKTIVIAGYGYPICFWDVATGKKVKEIDECFISDFVISPKEDLIITSGRGNDFFIKVRELATGKKRYKIKGNDKEINNLSISYDGKIIATGGLDKTIRLFDTESGKEIYKYVFKEELFHASKVKFSPFSNVVAFCGPIGGGFSYNFLDGTVSNPDDNKWSKLIIFDVTNQKELLNIKHVPDLDSVIFLPPHGETLVSLCDAVQLWDLKDGRQISMFVPYMKDAFCTCAVSPDGSTLAIGDDMGYIKLWDIKTGKEIKIIK